MPQPIRQFMRKAVVQSTPRSSILARAVDVSAMKDDVMKVLIYGKNRVGKTTLACHWPKPLLLVSFESNKTGGCKSVTEGFPGVKFLAVRSYREAGLLAQELKGTRDFKTIVMDSVTAYQDLALREIMYGENADPSQQIPEQLDWGVVKEDQYRDRSSKCKEALRAWVNLDVHTIMLAKEKDHNPPKDERNKLIRGFKPEYYLAADLGAATVDWLNDTCDYICRLYADDETKIRKRKIPRGPGKFEEIEEEYLTGRQVHRLRTLFHKNLASGFRSPVPSLVPEYIEVDNDLPPEEQSRLMYEEIVRIAQGRPKQALPVPRSAPHPAGK